MYPLLSEPETTAQTKNGHQPQKQTPVSRPDTQVLTRPSRRRFTADYKRRIIKEADACTRHGELGELLRREGLYSSTLASFRKQQDSGRLAVADPQIARAQRKQKEATRQRDARRIAGLEAENQKLRALIDLQKKLSDLIGIPLLTQPGE
jgi:transposase